MKNPKQTKDSFEESLKKIEELATLLEDGDLPLQKRVEKFEEGMRLLRKCENELKDVELIIQKVVDKNGELKVENLKELNENL